MKHSDVYVDKRLNKMMEEQRIFLTMSVPKHEKKKCNFRSYFQCNFHVVMSLLFIRNVNVEVKRSIPFDR